VFSAIEGALKLKNRSATEVIPRQVPTQSNHPRNIPHRKLVAQQRLSGQPLQA
jgi:hypothetical protein